MHPPRCGASESGRAAGSMLMNTPPFVRWTLRQACRLRELTDIADVEQTERQLRSLREYSDAVHQGRCHAGICLRALDGDLRDVHAAMGFPADEVLAAYGGAELVEAQCGRCAVNLLRGRPGSGLAGCFGLYPLDEAEQARWETALAQVEAGILTAAPFLPTQPRWVGLWHASPLTVSQLEGLRALLAEPCLRAEASRERVELAQAIERALLAGVELHLRLYPPGTADGQHWTIASHCRRCRAPMNDRERRCGVCCFVGRPEPTRRRKTRGSRPYLPLVRFLGETRSAALLEKVREGLREGRMSKDK